MHAPVPTPDKALPSRAKVRRLAELANCAPSTAQAWLSGAVVLPRASADLARLAPRFGLESRP